MIFLMKKGADIAGVPHQKPATLNEHVWTTATKNKNRTQLRSYLDAILPRNLNKNIILCCGGESCAVEKSR